MRPARPPFVPGPPAALVLGLPDARADQPPLAHIAVAADPWPGRVGIWRRDVSGAFTLDDVAEAPALIGRTLTALPPGPVWRWDRRSRLTLRLPRGAITAIGPEAALAGGNLLAIRGPDDAWEVVSAAEATFDGPSIYTLSGLLRGLGGTEAEAGRTVPAGADIVVLDGAVRPLTVAPNDVGVTIVLRIASASRGPSDPTAIELSATVGGTALRPFAPVHVRARRVDDGVRLSWLRRTRVDGDGWSPSDVPLGEEEERYELDILRDGGPVRTLSSTAPTLLYPAAAEVSDFGAPQASLSLSLAQVSRLVGRGRPCEATIPIR